MTAAHRGALVADLVGRLRLLQNLGEPETTHAVERCHKRIERSIIGWQGEISSLGDEIVALFPDAESALQAAIDVQQRIADLPPASGINLTLKIGVDGRAEEPTTTGFLVDAARRLSERAAVGQIIVSGWLAEALTEPSRKGLRRIAGAEDDRKPLFECGWRELTVATPTAPDHRLRLRRGGRIWILEPGGQPFTVGRDEACDLVLTDRSVSRRHARVESRGGRWLLVDESTNGSYVAAGSGGGQPVRRVEVELRGSGTLAFGRPAASSNDETVTFEVL